MPYSRATSVARIHSPKFSISEAVVAPPERRIIPRYIAARLIPAHTRRVVRCVKYLPNSRMRTSSGTKTMTPFNAWTYLSSPVSVELKLYSKGAISKGVLDTPSNLDRWTNSASKVHWHLHAGPGLALTLIAVFRQPLAAAGMRRY